MVIAFVAVVIGVVRLAKSLQPRQRVVLVLVFALGIAYVVTELMELGLLGRQTVQ